METMMAAGMILSPLGLIICVLIPAITVLLARRPHLSAARLAAGYIGALFALAIVVGVSSYVSPQDAVSVWHIPPDRYWAAIIEDFVGTYVVGAFASIVGISFVGIPVLIGLSRLGVATVPWFVASALAISTAIAILAYALMHSFSDITFLGILGFLVVTHGILAFGFALAARLPWDFQLEP
jgi:hypothetical protein